MRYIYIIGILFISLALLAGCAAGPNNMEKSADSEGRVAGFWLGLWHGFIAPITFIISLFSDNVHMYEVHNNGNWYNLGFLIGAAVMLGGSGSASKRKNR
jgi:hypothetical protein